MFKGRINIGKDDLQLHEFGLCLVWRLTLVWPTTS